MNIEKTDKGIFVKVTSCFDCPLVEDYGEYYFEGQRCRITGNTMPDDGVQPSNCPLKKQIVIISSTEPAPGADHQPQQPAPGTDPTA